MPRSMRLDFEGAWQHVFNRGAAKQPIFRTDTQRILFLKLLGDITKEQSIEIHAYCLMTNHFHLLLHTPKANLSKAMQYIIGIYTKKYNEMMLRDGPLLRGRYRSIVVDADSYLLQVSRYIHLNPIAANICENIEEYKWSSYLTYINGWKHPWLQTSFLLNMMNSQNSREAYGKFHSRGVDEDINKFYAKKNLSPILGNKALLKNKGV